MNLNTTINRLSKLADLLDVVPAKDFDYGTWIRDNSCELKLTKKGCGTQGCALGWATTIPSLKRVGLRMSEYGEPMTDNCGEAFSAGAEVFGLTTRESEHLFAPDEYNGELYATPMQVAKKIRQFIKTKVNNVKLQKKLAALEVKLVKVADKAEAKRQAVEDKLAEIDDAQYTEERAIQDQINEVQDNIEEV